MGGRIERAEMLAVRERSKERVRIEIRDLRGRVDIENARADGERFTRERADRRETPGFALLGGQSFFFETLESGLNELRGVGCWRLECAE